jgi:hypothetical protein
MTLGWSGVRGVTMNFAGMNYLAILIAAAAGFAFGAAYYMSLSRQWLAAVGKTKEDIAGKRSATPFIISIVALVVMAWILAGGIGRKPMLSVIDGIHWLGVLVIQGAIIGAMGV